MHSMWFTWFHPLVMLYFVCKFKHTAVKTHMLISVEDRSRYDDYGRKKILCFSTIGRWTTYIYIYIYINTEYSQHLISCDGVARLIFQQAQFVYITTPSTTIYAHSSNRITLCLAVKTFLTSYLGSSTNVMDQ